MWDYDWLTFTQDTGWHCRNYLWYPRLFEDPEFRALLKERWKVLYPVFAATGGYISKKSKELKKSADLDWTMWQNNVGPNGDQSLSYDAAVSRMVSRLNNRLAWLNDEINAL